jgi:hypothetical protein
MLTSMAPTLSSVTMSDTFMLGHSHPHSQANSPVPTIASSSSDPSMQSSFGLHLHPHNWMGPTSVPWDTLGASMGQFKFESDVV